MVKLDVKINQTNINLKGEIGKKINLFEVLKVLKLLDYNCYVDEESMNFPILRIKEEYFHMTLFASGKFNVYCKDVVKFNSEQKKLFFELSKNRKAFI